MNAEKTNLRDFFNFNLYLETDSSKYAIITLFEMLNNERLKKETCMSYE